MKTSTKVLKWKQSRNGLAVSAVVELLLAYIVGSRALDTGSWWEYLFAFVLLIGGIHNTVKLIKVSISGNKPKSGQA